MEETIELRELVETVWRGKWIIASVTAIFVLFAGIVSWFVIPEEYESQATVKVVKEIEPTGLLSKYILEEFSTSTFSAIIKDTTLMNIAFKEAGLKDNLNMGELLITPQEEAGLIDVKYKSNSAKQAQEQLALALKTTKNELNSSMKKTLVELEETVGAESSKLSSELEKSVGQYNEIISLNQLPDILIMQSLVSSQMMLSVSDDQLAALAKMDGKVHNDLIQLQVQITSKSLEYQRALDKLQTVQVEIENYNPDTFIKTINEPSISSSPVTPNKFSNIVIATILGIIVGVGFVFIRQYWRNTATVK